LQLARIVHYAQKLKTHMVINELDTGDIGIMDSSAVSSDENVTERVAANVVMQSMVDPCDPISLHG